jgi:hypothetical protein
MDGIVNGVTYVHTFTRYTDAGAEARAARIYGGMHFEFSNEASALTQVQHRGWRR